MSVECSFLEFHILPFYPTRTEFTGAFFDINFTTIQTFDNQLNNRSQFYFPNNGLSQSLDILYILQFTNYHNL